MTRLQFLLTSLAAFLAALIPWGWKPKSSFRAKYVSASKPVHPEIGYTCTTYSIMRRRHNGVQEYQWRTSNGQEMSPIFHNMDDAVGFKYSGKTYADLLVMMLPKGETWDDLT